MNCVVIIRELLKLKQNYTINFAKYVKKREILNKSLYSILIFKKF